MVTCKLSIIIPVYNVEPYIGETLASVFETTAMAGEFEVIVVNDGTKDGSMRVVRRYSDKPNIIILEQDNQGLSAARMKGLSMARGEYVWFVDSDDRLVKDGVGIVMRLLKEMNGTDVLMFPIHWENQDIQEYRLDYNIGDETVVKGMSVIRDLHLPVWAAPRFVFRRSLTDNPWLFFPKSLIHEDEYFGPVLMCLSNRVWVKSEPVYNYLQRTGSIITTRSIRSAYDMVSVHKLLIRFMEKALDSADEGWFRHYCFNRLFLVYRHFKDSLGTSVYQRFSRRNGFYVWRQWSIIHPEASLKKRIGRLLFFMMPGLHKRLFETEGRSDFEVEGS